jgi:hypothetical protein
MSYKWGAESGRTRRHDRRRVSISSEDGGVQRLNIAEGIFVANRSIVSLSIDDGRQQRQQERKKGGHCELLLNGSSKWLVSVHHGREPTFLYARAHRSDTFEPHGRSDAGSRQWVLPTLSIHTTSCLFRAWRIMCVNKVNGTLKSQRQPRTWSLDSGQNKA